MLSLYFSLSYIRTLQVFIVKISRESGVEFYFLRSRKCGDNLDISISLQYLSVQNEVVEYYEEDAVKADIR